MKIVLPSVSLAILLVAVWVVTHIDQVAKTIGYVASGLARVWTAADRTAVKFRTEGEINAAVEALSRTIPPDVLQGKLSIKWVRPSEAQALIRDGEVLVCMKRSAHQEENVVTALSSYLPRAVLPRARRYVAPGLMRAVDLVLAKSLLVESGLGAGYLQVFYDRELDPALREDEVLAAKVERTEAIDVSGWLTRIFLKEIQALGDQLYPAEGRTEYALEAERFHSWLYVLAGRPSGKRRPLAFRGELLTVGMIMVARRATLEQGGLDPYLRWFDTYMNEMKADRIYIVGSDDTIPSVKALLDAVAADPRVDKAEAYEYRPRRQFRAQVAPRDCVICGVVARKPAAPQYLAASSSLSSDQSDQSDRILVLNAARAPDETEDLSAVHINDPELDEAIEGVVEEDIVAVRESLDDETTPDADEVENVIDLRERESVPDLREVGAYVLTWARDRGLKGRPAYVSALGWALRRRYPGSEPLYARLGYKRMTDLLREMEGVRLVNPGPKMALEIVGSHSSNQGIDIKDVEKFVLAWAARRMEYGRDAFLSSLGSALARRFPGKEPVHERLSYPSLVALLKALPGVTVELGDRAVIRLSEDSGDESAVGGPGRP